MYTQVHIYREEHQLIEQCHLSSMYSKTLKPKARNYWMQIFAFKRKLKFENLLMASYLRNWLNPPHTPKKKTYDGLHFFFCVNISPQIWTKQQVEKVSLRQQLKTPH